MRLIILSFGWKHRQPPAEADLVLDARSMPNPWGVRALRDLDGRDPAVKQWLAGRFAFEGFLDAALQQVYDTVHQKGDRHATVVVAVGCMGGRHRSVCGAEELAARVRRRKWAKFLDMEVSVDHLELRKEEQ